MQDGRGAGWVALPAARKGSCAVRQSSTGYGSGAELTGTSDIQCRKLRNDGAVTLLSSCFLLS